MRAIFETDQTTDLPEDWRSDRSGFDDMPFRIFRDNDGDSGERSSRAGHSTNIPAVSRMRARKAVGTNFRPAGPTLRATLGNTGRPNLLSPAPRVAAAGVASPVPTPPMTGAQDAIPDGGSVASIVAEVLSQLSPKNEHRMSTPGVALNVENAAFSDMTLRAYYVDRLRAERTRRVFSGRNKTGTAEKDLAALGFWERCSGNPPLREITPEVVQNFIGAALKTGRRSTARGYCGHLRWMLNEAKRAGAVASVPAFTFPKVSRRSGLTEAHRETMIYELGGDLLGTLGRIHDAIECPELRLAFVCGASFGPRTEDLLTLDWSAFDLTGERPVVRYVAEKTGTFHVVPLAPWLVAQLTAARTDARQVFPTLISHSAAIPAKSRAARRTVANLRAAAASIGFDFSQGGRTKAAEQKPFQILRATCNERFERHHRRAGEWILGHAMNSLNRKSYQNPASEIFNAVLSLPQPEQFVRNK